MASNDPPPPSVDPTRVRVLAAQNQNIMQSQEATLVTLAKLTKKRGSSAASSVSAGDDSNVVAENTEVQTAMTALKGELVNAILDQYKTFLKDNKKHMYVTRTTRASADANEFHDHLTAFFASIDEAHPALGHLDKLNADLKLDLYAFLGKTTKDKDKSTKNTATAGKKGKGDKTSGGTTGETVSGEEAGQGAAGDDSNGSPSRRTRPPRRAAAKGTKRKAIAVQDTSSDDQPTSSPSTRRNPKQTRFSGSTHGGSSPLTRNTGPD